MAAFDSANERVGDEAGGLTVRPMSDLAFAVSEMGISIGIVAVPAAQAQNVIDALVRNGISGILNYAPVTPIRAARRGGAEYRPDAFAAVYDFLSEGGRLVGVSRS